MNRRQARKHGAKEEREVKRQVKQIRVLKIGAPPNSRRRQWWKAWHRRWIIEGRKESTMTWRDEPITDKQKTLIDDMMEFSAYSLPKFTGSTKGEASDYIDKYGKLAHENVNSPTFGY